MTRLLVSLAALTLIYLMVLASFGPWDLLIGVGVSLALLMLHRRFLFGGRPLPLPSLIHRTVAFFPFAWAVARDVALGTWTVSLIVLHVRPIVRPGIVAVPIAERTVNGVVTSSLVTTLSPGSFLVDVDWDRGVMLFHVIDASDPDAIRAAYQELYLRYQRHFMP